MCDDYRAAIDHDLTDDRADLHHRVTAPALVLYGADGIMARAYDVETTWAPRLLRMRVQSMPGGHFFPDTHPQETAHALRVFLTQQRSL